MFTIETGDRRIGLNNTGNWATSRCRAWSSSHAATARRAAAEAAQHLDEAVQVLRNGRIAYVVMPDGSTQPPPLARVPVRAVCTKGSGRACFCVACRAERKARR